MFSVLRAPFVAAEMAGAQRPSTIVLSNREHGYPGRRPGNDIGPEQWGPGVDKRKDGMFYR